MSEYSSTHRPISMRKFAATALIIALSVPSSFAFADANTAADIYRDASEAYQKGNFTEAASLLEKAYIEDKNLIYKYNQILAYMGAHNHAEALRVLNKHSEAMKADGRFDDIDEIRHQLETSVAEKEKADKEKLAANNTSSANNENSGNSVVAPSVNTDNSSPNYVAWSLVGVGGAAMISSALFFNYAFAPDEAARHDKVEQNLKLDNISRNDAWNRVYGGDQNWINSDVKTLNNQLLIGRVMLGTGIVLAGTGLALWYFDVPGGSTEQNMANKKPDDSKTLQVRFSPYFSTGSAGASMNLTF